MKYKFLGAVALVVVCGFVLFGCSRPEDDDDKDKATIVTSFYPMYEFTKEIVGDRFNVVTLVKPGVEPHEFDPSAKDVKKIKKADLVIYNSSSMEKWMTKIIASDSDKGRFVEAAKGIEMSKGTGEDKNDIDPHVWLSLKLARQEVANIRDVLVKKYPKWELEFNANADLYIQKLDALDHEYRQAFEPAGNKRFVTQHAAFHYLAEDYGLDMIAISGLSTEEEPSPKKLAEIKKTMTKYNLDIVYTEENVSSKVAKTLAKEGGYKTVVLNPIESITKKDQEAGENYLEIMRTNLKALKESVR